MSDATLTALAKQAGLLVRWIDANGRSDKVGTDTLRSVLRALELPADSEAQISESRAEMRRQRAIAPPLIVARGGKMLRLPGCRHAQMILDGGERIAIRRSGKESFFRVPREPGYHHLECDEESQILAVAPPRCVGPEDVAPGRLSGISVQIYSLRGGTSGAFGDFAALGAFARGAGRLGFDAVLASPAHAQFGADPARFTPYSPSTRIFLNPLFADASLDDVSTPEDDNADRLIDWKRAGRAKFKQLRLAFERFRKRRNHGEFESFCRQGGQRLLTHALFEALDGAFLKKGIRGFRNWPRGFESPQAPGVAAFARACREELQYQLYLQWLVARSAARAQLSARETMTIGIIADIAVGMDPEGSHAWSAPHELLRGLHVGAPPDAFNPRGQDWGLTTLSPRAMTASGYASFLATIRASMRHAGGVRIDHAMGLRRLWVIPSGASPGEGVYLCYPERALLSLLALESHLNRSIVIGEDLGTVPEGFRDAIAAVGVLGMQVLWFERNSKGQFASPEKWRRDAVAMTTTHDLPPVAGWWRGFDIELQERAGILRGAEEPLRAERAADRRRLWSAFRRAKCASGAPPAPDGAGVAIEGALNFVAGTRAAIAFASLEDIEGDVHQPNLPGTTNKHPNWRRRMKNGDLLRRKPSRERAKAFVAARRASS